MASKQPIAILCRVGLLWLTLSAAVRAEDEPLLVASGEFKPFTSSEYYGGGFLHELVMRAFLETELPAQDLFLPWGRGFSGVQKHHFAVTFPYVWTQRRSATFLYSKPLIAVSGALYVRRSKAAGYHEPKDLAGLLLCLPKHFSSEFLKPFVGDYRLRLVRAADDLGCLEMLALGRVDGTPVDVLRAQELMKDNKQVARDVVVLPWTVSNKTYHLLIDKSYPDAQDILSQFDHAYGKLKASSEWDSILQKYTIDSRWAQKAHNRIVLLPELGGTD